MSAALSGLWKKHRLLALICYLLIPAAAIGGVAIAMLIDPEFAAGSADYERNFRWLTNLKHGLLLATAGAVALLCLATCCFAVLGFLRDRAPAAGGFYAAFVQGLRWPVRIAYEAGFFAAVWVGAYLIMVLKREVAIRIYSAVSGVPADQIVREQLASSGMWAVGEGLVILYLVPLAYLARPMVFNAVASWRRAG